jgi:hypothetical protein
MPEIVMPEMHSLNISADIVFPELQPVELVIDFPFDEEEIASLGLNQTTVVKDSEPAEYFADVHIFQRDQFIIAESVDGRQIATSPIESDVASLFKAAVDAVPDGGSLHISKGFYILSAPYAFPLNPDGSNIFHCSIPVLDKDMHISGDGMDETVIQLLPGQRSPSRHVAMMIIRGTRGYDPGYENFTVRDLTLDGNRAAQTDGQPHDGEGLILVGSTRSNGKYDRLRLMNSWGSGAYLGNNGAGSGKNEIVSQVVAQNCGAEGIMLDTCHNSSVIDCAGWRCREGLCLYGNDDWQSRIKDNVWATNFQTDSQVTVWQVNDFVLSDINMDCSQATDAYGLMIRDGTGLVENSVLKSDTTKPNSTGGATYIQEGSEVLFVDCQLVGYFGIHAVGQSFVVAKNCNLIAPGGCFCTTDYLPVQSTIIAENCTWSGTKTAMQAGAMFQGD